MDSTKLPLSRWIGYLKQGASPITKEIRAWAFQRRVRTSFDLISCNCFGAEAYRELRRPYSTPFVGLFVPPESFIRLCADFDRYMNEPLHFIGKPGFARAHGQGEYPVGTLGGEVEIHFMHYASCAEAGDKWTRRTERLLSRDGRRRFMFCDRDVCDPEQIRRFDALPIEHKVCFTAQPYPGCPSAIWVQDDTHKQHVAIGTQLYEIVRRRFDLASWLNGGALRARRGLFNLW